MLSDAEWAQVAAGSWTAPGSRPPVTISVCGGWRSGTPPDHIHIVATLARQDRIRPRIWNDYYRVREACQDAERRFGLRPTAPADRTAARRPTRAETEQAIRRGWAEPPRVTLRREVCTAAAGARTEAGVLRPAGAAGVLVRKRYSTVNPGRGHRVRGRAAPPHGAGRRGGLVRRREARRRSDVAEAARPAGPDPQARDPFAGARRSARGGPRRAADHGHPGGGTRRE